MKSFKTIDEYIMTFPKNTQRLLEEVRATIREKAPEATKHIAYGMPVYKTLGKPPVYFAALKTKTIYAI